MSWLPIAKKEYLENVRNAWVVAVGGIFLALTLAASAFASALAGAGGLADIGRTLTLMGNVTDFLLPILALMLGFGTLAGERESGSLALLVAQPVTRLDVVLGKALGLFGVLATAIVAGVGVGGLVVLARTGAGAADLGTLLTYLLVTLSWGAAWTSVTLLLSAFFQRRGTAIAGAVGVWFLFTRFVWTIVTLLVVFAVAGRDVASLFQGRQAVPGWLIATQLLNPNTVYDGLLATTIDTAGGIVSGVARGILPDQYTLLTFVVAMAAWIALPFWGAYALFARKDV